jgi:hypothetical protein
MNGVITISRDIKSVATHEERLIAVMSQLLPLGRPRLLARAMFAAGTLLGGVRARPIIRFW